MRADQVAPAPSHYVDPFDDDGAALVDISGLLPLDNLMQEPLDFVANELPYTTVPDCPATLPDPFKMQSMPSLDSATSSTGEQVCQLPLASSTRLTASPLPPTWPIPATPQASPAMSPSPSVSHGHPECSDHRRSTQSPGHLQEMSEPETVKAPPAPRRERKRRQQSSFTVSKLAKQREKNRRCQRSFRERQKVKQEALLQELQDLKDRCAWLESQLALRQSGPQ